MDSGLSSRMKAIEEELSRMKAHSEAGSVLAIEDEVEEKVFDLYDQTEAVKVVKMTLKPSSSTKLAARAVELKDDLSNYRPWKSKILTLLRHAGISKKDQEGLWEGKYCPDTDVNDLIVLMVQESTESNEDVHTVFIERIEEDAVNSRPRMYVDVLKYWNERRQNRKAVKSASLSEMRFRSGALTNYNTEI